MVISNIDKCLCPMDVVRYFFNLVKTQAFTKHKVARASLEIHIGSS